MSGSSGKDLTIEEIHAWAEPVKATKANIQLVDSLIPGDYILVHVALLLKIAPEHFRFLNETLMRYWIQEMNDDRIVRKD